MDVASIRVDPFQDLESGFRCVVSALRIAVPDLCIQYGRALCDLAYPSVKDRKKILSVEKACEVSLERVR